MRSQECITLRAKLCASQLRIIRDMKMNFRHSIIPHTYIHVRSTSEWTQLLLEMKDALEEVISKSDKAAAKAALEYVTSCVEGNMRELGKDEYVTERIDGPKRVAEFFAEKVDDEGSHSETSDG